MNLHSVLDEIIAHEQMKKNLVKNGDWESKLIGTHTGPFHTDDILGCAILKIAYKDLYMDILRTRPEDKTLDICFARIDIGLKYEPENNSFDHHQWKKDDPNRIVRENSIPYASAGLVWKSYGELICGSKEVADLVEETLILSVDANDNGMALSESKDGNYEDYTFARYVSLCKPFNEENPDYDTPFFHLVLEAMATIKMEVALAKKAVEDLLKIRKIYEEMDHEQILVLDGNYNWQKWIDYFPKLLFVIHPYEKDNWGISAVQKSKRKRFEYRKLLPERWTDETSVDELKFVHKNLFFAKLAKKEQAIKRALEAVENTDTTE